MKLKVLVVSVLAFLVVGVSSASAYYYMTYWQAKNETAELASETCRENCIHSEAGPCHRRSRSAFDCVMIRTYGFVPQPGEEVQGPIEVDCYTLLHWGVNRRGIITLKGYGEPHCFRR
jgi:hypothetical protein